MDQIRVVLTEKHPIIRAGIQHFLEKDTAITVVGETDDEHETLHLVSQYTPDVLVLDMLLPYMLGFKIASRLQTNFPLVRILALSEYDDGPYIAKILASGVAGCLLKEEVPQIITEAAHAIAQSADSWFSHKVTSKLLSQRNDCAIPISTTALSQRETQILQLLAQGEDNQKIAKRLCLSLGTVKNHITNIYTKIRVQTRAGAVAWAWQHGLIHSPLWPLSNDEQSG